MIKINVTKITLNENKIKQIAHFASSTIVADYLQREAKEILRESFPKIPYNIRSKNPHLRDLYEVSKPLKASFKIDGTKYPSTQVKIKPRGKYKTYYAVVTAGKRNGKPINYSLPSSQPYVLEKAVRKRNNKMYSDLTSLIVDSINRVENTNDQ